MAEEMFFAARRYKSNDGSPLIILVSMKTGKRVYVDEVALSVQYRCALGDFLSFNGDKITKKGFLTSTVEGGVAFVDNICAKLVNVDGVLLFQSNFFSYALCTEQLSPGDYEIKINLRETEYLLPSGVPIHFEATNARPIKVDSPTHPTFTPISGFPSALPPWPSAPRVINGKITFPRRETEYLLPIGVPNHFEANAKENLEESKMAEEMFFAARRYKSNDGSPLIILVSMKTGKRVSVDEMGYRVEHGCGLGDFLSLNGGKPTKKEYLTTTAVGDVAFVDNIRAKLVNVDGVLLFQSNRFTDALCTQKLSPGDYEIKINLRETEYLLPSGVPIHFEATNARLIKIDSPTHPNFTPIFGFPSALPPWPPAPRVINGKITFPRRETEYLLPIGVPNHFEANAKEILEESKMAKEIFLAARRCESNDGSPLIILVSMKTGKRVSVDEMVLRVQHGCGLGDFLSLNGGKPTKKSYLASTVEGDVAFVDHIRAKVVNVDGVLLFQSYLFSDALCTEKLSPEEYEIKINLRETEYLLPSGVPIHFEATNARLIKTDPLSHPTFTPIFEFPSALPPCPPAPGTPPPSPSFPGSSNSGSRAPTPAGNGE